MPGIESFGRSERELKRRLAVIEKQVQAETKPLGDIGLAIMQAATSCRDAAKPLIQAPSEKDRIQREIYVFYEFIYFFMHITKRQAFAVLSAPQMEKLQGYLDPLISSTAIDSYFAHWPEDLKQKITRDFYEKLNESEVEYSECAKSVMTAMRLGLRPVSNNPVDQALVTTLASNVANLAVDDETALAVIIPVTQAAITQWNNMRLDALVANVDEDRMTPKAKALKDRLRRVKYSPETMDWLLNHSVSVPTPGKGLGFPLRNRSEPKSTQEIVQKDLPEEKMEAFLKLARMLIGKGINTPQELARHIPENGRPYAQALWDTLRIVNRKLPAGDHDWEKIFACELGRERS